MNSSIAIKSAEVEVVQQETLTEKLRALLMKQELNPFVKVEIRVLPLLPQDAN